MASRTAWKAPSPPAASATIPTWRPRRAGEGSVGWPPARDGRGSPSRSASRGVLLLALLAAVCVTSLWAARGLVPTSPARAQADQPFLTSQPVVVLADRLVCSLLGGAKERAGIVGQDGSHTAVVDGLVYWDFGDTVLDDGTWLPNTLAWSADSDASDCITLAPVRAGSRAMPLLPSDLASELTVWPLGMEATAPGKVSFYYASVVPDAELGWRVTGVGIGSFDTETLTGERALGGALPWREGLPLPSRTFADDRYVYVFLGISREPWTTDTVLARVPRGAMESPASYQYWEPGDAGTLGRWRGGLWDGENGSWEPAVTGMAPLWRQPGTHNGVEVAYNEYLGRWLAVYTTGFMTSVNVRAADELTGPWDGPEAVLVNCPTFHPPPQQGWVCYTGAQHEFYARDGGRTIYVSYSNGDAYQVYLHEVRLAAPVSQWSDGQGRAVYLPDGAQAPEGFQPDGLAFYAADTPVPGLSPVHRWQHLESGAIRYGASPPGPRASYRDLGVDFYAPAHAAAAEATNALAAPVYRWTKGDLERYSPLNLGAAGFAQQETAFYAACPDADNDTLTDCLESFLGTSPSAADTDADGLHDGYERSTPGCDPLAYNDDGDGVWWFYELLAGTNPCVADAAAATPSPTSPPPLSPAATPTRTRTPAPTSTPVSMPTAGPTPRGASTLFGDVDCGGAVNAIDGLMVAQADAGVIASLPCPYLAHVNTDGAINALDALLILQYDAGIIDSLPVWGSGG